jgi:acetyl-CoA synthetase
MLGPFAPLSSAELSTASTAISFVISDCTLLAPVFFCSSTGRPKGVAHTTGGYLLTAAVSHKYIFDYRPGDVYACVADCGWVTGHSYVVYGPLANGATTVMFESTPLFPDPSRYWEMVERLRITQFYTAPTAIRALMRFGSGPVEKHDLSSLRILGSVGEPINPEAWLWYHNVVGKGGFARMCQVAMLLLFVLVLFR